MKIPRIKQKGFSLVEVVIALGLVAIAIPTLMGMFSFFSNISTSTRDRSDIDSVTNAIQIFLETSSFPAVYQWIKDARQSPENVSVIYVYKSINDDQIYTTSSTPPREDEITILDGRIMAVELHAPGETLLPEATLGSDVSEYGKAYLPITLKIYAVVGVTHEPTRSNYLESVPPGDHPMKKTHLPPRSAGITLLELLVAMSVGMILILILAAMTDAASRWSLRIQSDLTGRHDVKVTLDYFERDITTIVSPESGKASLTIAPEQVDGPNGVSVQSAWMMLLSRSAVSSEQGAIRAVSFRLVYADPMTPNGSYPRYALYRTVISPKAGANNSFLDAPDLKAGYWNQKWPQYLAQNSGRDILDDYILEDIVDFSASVQYTYKDSSGARHTVSTEIGQLIHWTDQGITGVPPEHVPNIPLSITLNLTLLSETGVTQMESGRSDLAEVIRKESVSASRTFPILSR